MVTPLPGRSQMSVPMRNPAPIGVDAAILMALCCAVNKVGIDLGHVLGQSAGFTANRLSLLEHVNFD